jgi:ribosomal protein S18 acetylase RimI-like enzyme
VTEAHHVRYATPDDLEILVPLFDAYRVFYEQPSDFRIARNFLQERLQLRESVILAAITCSGEAVGFVQLYPSFSSVAARRIWILNDLYVATKARGSGASRALMNAAKAHARFTGAARITLSTAITNKRAQRLYESLGYVRDEQYFTYDLTVT